MKPLIADDQDALFDLAPAVAPTREQQHRDERIEEIDSWHARLDGMSRPEMDTYLRGVARDDYEQKLAAFRTDLLEGVEGPCRGRWSLLRAEAPWGAEAVYESTWGLREEPDLTGLPEGYIIGCACGWMTSSAHEWSAAVALFDHTTPTWRELPIASDTPAYGASKAKERSWAAAARAAAPEGWSGPWRYTCTACSVLGELDGVDGVRTDHGSRGVHNESLLGGAWLICACDCHADENQGTRPGRCGYTGHARFCGAIATVPKLGGLDELILPIDGGRADERAYPSPYWDLCPACATAQRLTFVLELEVGNEPFYGFHPARARNRYAPDGPTSYMGGAFFHRTGARDPFACLTASRFRDEFRDSDQAWWMDALRDACAAAGYGAVAVDA